MRAFCIIGTESVVFVCLPQAVSRRHGAVYRRGRTVSVYFNS